MTPPLWGTSLVAQTVSHLSTMREIWLRSLGWENLLEKETAIHFSTIAWKTPWTEEPGRLQSLRSQSQTQLKRLSTHLTHYLGAIIMEISHLPLANASKDLRQSCLLTKAMMIHQGGIELGYLDN